MPPDLIDVLGVTVRVPANATISIWFKFVTSCSPFLLFDRLYEGDDMFIVPPGQNLTVGTSGFCSIYSMVFLQESDIVAGNGVVLATLDANVYSTLPVRLLSTNPPMNPDFMVVPSSNRHTCGFRVEQDYLVGGNHIIYFVPNPDFDPILYLFCFVSVVYENGEVRTLTTVTSSSVVFPNMPDRPQTITIRLVFPCDTTSETVFPPPAIFQFKTPNITITGDAALQPILVP